MEFVPATTIIALQKGHTFKAIATVIPVILRVPRFACCDRLEQLQLKVGARHLQAGFWKPPLPNPDRSLYCPTGLFNGISP